MTMAASSSTPAVYYTYCCCHSTPPKRPTFLFFNPIPKPTNPFSLSSPNDTNSSAPLPLLSPNPSRSRIVAKASSSTGGSTSSSSGEKRDGKKALQQGKKLEEEEEVEVEEELPWIQEKALDLVEFTGSVTQAIPGPRVGQSSWPWFLAVPLAYLGITFVLALVKTVRKFNSPKEKRRKLVNKNAMLCKSIDELFEKGTDQVTQSSLHGLRHKTGFTMEEVLRKYIRYVLNEKPFNPDLVANLIQLRKATGLDDSQVAAVLNDISKRIVKEKGDDHFLVSVALSICAIFFKANVMKNRIGKDVLFDTGQE